MKTLKEIATQLEKDLVDSIQSLVKIESVEGEAQQGKPFGSAVDEALRYTLSLGEELGFRTFYGEGYYGYIEMGQGDELVGILAHLDVVPVENPDQWSHPVFEGEIHEGKLYGRGAVDDKGPLLAALYAMKAVAEASIPLHKRVRLILGTNEETKWQGIVRYLQQEEVPSIAFTPDSDYPLINAEKGLLQVKLSPNTPDPPPPFKLTGGGTLNSVPDYCTYEGEDIDSLTELATSLGYTHKALERNFSISGKSAHSAKAWLGENAISRMAILLTKAKFTSPLIAFIAEQLGEDVYATTLFGSYEDEVSGKITLNPAGITINQEEESLSVDIRYPVTKTKEDVLAILEKALSSYEIQLEVLDHLPSLHVPLDHPLVKTLRQIFEEETGLDSTPLSTGGATYARALDNCVAFGPLFPGKTKMAHQTDEYVDLDDLMKSLYMYARAIASLAE
ncbi:dipeptidase, putative [Alkaliphilus metalliredigens QYMF]|uniref:Dipeptidase, putative n=1 Tax=Alkaliphilus metalliredigens (strain QYMF) TaxID=293826 RepID=A6TN14_ALKMQ|nr:Sapep family Mn(2+)-dependent dipeptidase [Alkaliphilus metalliredigens]ABR47582.1 dipeptidase, putative [Alkaliphilus metalliredigens QYMF]